MSKIKNFFIKVFIGMIDTVAVLELCVDESAGGLSLNGFFAFVVWLAVMYLLIKVNPYLSLVVSIGLYLILRVILSGSIESISAYLYLFAICAALFIAYRYYLHRVKISDKAGDRWRVGEVCPGCGYDGQIIRHAGRTNTHTVHDGEEGYYGGSSAFGFFNSGTWYEKGDVVTEEYPPYYECPKCGRKWTSDNKKM